MRRYSFATLIGSTVLGVAAVALPGGVLAASSGGTSKVGVREWVISPAPARLTAGKITFVVTNRGKVTHEFVVLRTDVAPAKLPVKNGRASEKGQKGEIGNLPAGATKRLTLTLPKGKYVLICNLSGHYRAGQHAALVVR